MAKGSDYMSDRNSGHELLMNCAAGLGADAMVLQCAVPEPKNPAEVLCLCITPSCFLWLEC